jgi:LacI family transcriptional regulator
MAHRKPTIKDIARVAGVSPTAVSMALNDRPRISPETRKRILRIAKGLNYQPNFVARSLVMKRSHTLGVIITTILNPFYPELAKGIEDRALELGYNIILCSTNYDIRLEKYYINMLRNKGVDGIIFSSVEVDDPNIRPLLQDRFPFVLVNRRIHHRIWDRKVDYIVLDNVSGGYMAMEHLYKLGHRRIGIVIGGLNISTAIERTEGAKKLLNDYGLTFDSDLVIECHFSKELAYQATKKFVAMENPPTAIFAENDYMALGSREAILDSELRIPENMALVGFDDIVPAALRGVEITTISQKKYEMGSLAAKIVIDRIRNGTASTVSQTILEPELIIRNSCGYRLYGYSNKGIGQKASPCAGVSAAEDRVRMAKCGEGLP